MIERTLWVKEIEWRKDKKDRDYAYITLLSVEEATNEQKETHKAEYPGLILDVLKEAHEKSLAVAAELEKEGNFWNIKSAVLMKDAIKKVEQPPAVEIGYEGAKNVPSVVSQAKPSPVPSKDVQIARAVALKASIEYHRGEDLAGVDAPLDIILHVSDLFTDWLLE